jgi:hypothetical protein
VLPGPESLTPLLQPKNTAISDKNSAILVTKIPLLFRYFSAKIVKILGRPYRVGTILQGWGDNERGNVNTLFAIGILVTTKGGMLLFKKPEILPNMPVREVEAES